MRFLINSIFAALLSATVSLGAHAGSLSAVDQFSGDNSSGPFFYGSGSVGAGFVKLPNFMADNCVGASGLACHNTPSGNYTLPIIGKNLTGGTLAFYDNRLPTDELFIQADLSNGFSILRFVAPSSGAFPIFASFERIDVFDRMGDGVVVGVSVNGGAPIASKLLANDRSLPASAYTLNFYQVLALNTGDTVDFFLDPRASIFNDGTGLRVLIPEPASLGLLGMAILSIGGLIRRKQG